MQAKQTSVWLARLTQIKWPHQRRIASSGVGSNPPAFLQFLSEMCRIAQREHEMRSSKPDRQWIEVLGGHQFTLVDQVVRVLEDVGPVRLNSEQTVEDCCVFFVRLGTGWRMKSMKL